MAGRIRAFDWATTPLGAIDQWPQSLKTATGLVINSPVPIVMLWGDDGVMIYNDAYSIFAGGRHPVLLGSNVRDGWPEVAEFNDNVMKVGLAGGTLAYKDQELTLHRSGQPEQVWMDLDYWPVPGEDGQPAGVIATVVETTAKVHADRLRKETNERLELALSAGRGVGTWDWDTTIDRVVADERFAELYGVDPVLAKNGAPLAEFFKAMHPDDAGRVGDEVQRAVLGLAPFRSEYRLVQADGEVRWVAAEGRVINDEAGKPVRFPGVTFDITDRRVTDAALAETETRYDTLFGATNTGFCIIEMKFDAAMRPIDYMIVEGNPAFSEMTGLHDANGKWVSEIAPGLEQHWFDLYGEVALTGKTARFENPADIFGRWYDVEALRIGDPAMQRVAILFTNITERKQIEARQAALLELTDTLRDLTDPEEIAHASSAILARSLNVTRAGYGVMDLAAETVTIARDYNAPGMASITGTLKFRDFGSYIDDLTRGQTVVVTNTALDARTAVTAEALAGIGVSSFINMPLTEQGRVVAIVFVNNVTPRLWSANDVELLGEVAARVRIAIERARAAAELAASATDLRRQGAELARLNEQLEVLLEGSTAERDRLWELSPDLLTVVNYEGQLERINPSWARVLGWDEQTLLSRPYAEILHPDEIESISELLAGMKADGRPVLLEDRLLTASGEWRTFAWTLSPEPGGERLYGVGRDVTEERAQTAQLASAQEALRQAQKMEAVGQLTGGIAHDFNNLLAGISGSLELLERRLGEGRLAGVERYISAAQGAARRAASLTQRLLAFSRRQTLDPKPTDVNRLINGMEDLIRRSVGPDVAVEVVGAGGLWLTQIDPSQLENALLNLCINGRDAMAPDGGRLTIETANKWLDERAARHRDLAPGQYISLCVTDTGTGMTPDVISKAFDPFFTTKPLGQGTGLGLSMIHGFVRQSGGQVRIYSEIGKGTTMCLYLPRYAGELDALDAPDVAYAGDPGHGETVLVIDDEPTVRMLVVEVLEDAGYIVMEAEDGPSGLRILQSDARIDLLVTDVGLPGGMNGRQVADAARVSRPDLKILFVTGYAENAAVGNGHLDPGMEVITKPFAMTVLGNKVREMIDG